MKRLKSMLKSKKLMMIAFMALILCKLYSQQITLNEYRATHDIYNTQIDQAIAIQEDLEYTKDNITSDDYIEQVAREQLDMYLPNERVYIDIAK